MFSIETVAILGATERGTSCAVLSALAGCAVRLFDPSDAALDRAFEAVRHRVEIAWSSGAITRTERQRILDGVLFTPDLEEALTGADLAVDALPAPAEEILERLAPLLRATSAVAAAGEVAPETIAARLPQAGRVLSLRLVDVQGPVPRVEVQAALDTSGHVLARAFDFAERVNVAARTAPAPRRGAAMEAIP